MDTPVDERSHSRLPEQNHVARLMAGPTPSVDVAVVVPTFNRLELLRETVASLEIQTLPRVRFVIVDDSSDSDTIAFLSTLAAGDARFMILAKPANEPRGCQASRNIGMDAADARAVVFLDSDDLLEPRCLEDRYAHLMSNPEIDIVVGRQAMMDGDRNNAMWVNVPNPKREDLDRILDLSHPIDVPWVNAGVMIRLESIRTSGIRWRPEFHWDDVAFHFECLAHGMRATWLPFDLPPDAYYRIHGEERFGSKLFTEQGLRSTAAMLTWMHATLSRLGKLDETRHAALLRSLFFTAVLRAIDGGDYSLASELTASALDGGLLKRHEAGNLMLYSKGRHSLARSERMTFYWNRMSERTIVPANNPNSPSTYGTIPVTRRA